MDHKKTVEAAMNWFTKASSAQQHEVAERLFSYAIRAGWIGVWDEETAIELSEEESLPLDYYKIPYLRTCGEPIVEFEDPNKQHDTVTIYCHLVNGIIPITYSLRPAGLSADKEYVLSDDGGKQYQLPDDYTFAETEEGPVIYHNQYRCKLIVHASGYPQLIDDSEEQAVLSLSE